MSYDPQLYVNGNATEIKPLPEPVKEKPVKAGDGLPPDLSLREAIATRELGPLKYSAEKGGYFCKCPGEATHTSRSGEKHTIVYLNSVPTLDCQHKSCKKIVEAFNVKLRSEIGKAERQANPGAAKVEVRSGETAGDGLLPTSLTSPGADVFPAPLEPAAFHGLAGRFVERIFPHTEADRAALLFSCLVAFGNVIGRTAHAIADGARHFCNLNVVLVGPTSKGRKGSARWHTNRLLGCVDEEWIENCIASGLSSGEGLIAAVQDAVTKQVKNKKSGKEETKIIEPGKTDKRLLVIQTEFSTALKAMEREGNTLSSVIRSAWDCEPKLRTLTKNSPTCATDPHISIVGHITAEELRPGLSEIEAANGFGNRFLWVPVKRSKELPEGGELPPIADLIEPLQNAVAGAKKRKEPLKRDEAAREFWAKIYHDLSAEQPGLFGAITARSEAQCLRLSDLYALLDCAPFVGVEHLEAALAAWRYCEKGARWIFRTGTGNRDADRILAALGAAGQKGLTRLQITNEVFSRHATKFEIDEALRLLHSLKLAVRKMEGTATRPAERWFCKAQQREVCEESNPGDGEMGDTSHSSHRPPSKNASLAESDKEAETLVGDESGVARL